MDFAWTANVWLASAPPAIDVAGFCGTFDQFVHLRSVFRWRPQGVAERGRNVGTLEEFRDGLELDPTVSASISAQARGLTVSAKANASGHYVIRMNAVQELGMHVVSYWSGSERFVGASLGRYEDYPESAADAHPKHGEGGWPMGPDFPAGTVWMGPRHPRYSRAEHYLGGVAKAVEANGVLRLVLYDSSADAERMAEEQRRFKDFFEF